LWSPGLFFNQTITVSYFSAGHAKHFFFSFGFRAGKETDFGAYCIFSREMQSVGLTTSNFFLIKLESQRKSEPRVQMPFHVNMFSLTCFVLVWVFWGAFWGFLVLLFFVFGKEEVERAPTK